MTSLILDPLIAVAKQKMPTMALGCNVQYDITLSRPFWEVVMPTRDNYLYLMSIMNHYHIECEVAEQYSDIRYAKRKKELKDAKRS